MVKFVSVLFLFCSVLGLWNSASHLSAHGWGFPSFVARTVVLKNSA